jgi:hypothetical protein
MDGVVMVVTNRFPYKKSAANSLHKWVNYCTDSLLEARGPKTFSLHPTHLPTNQPTHWSTYLWIILLLIPWRKQDRQPWHEQAGARAHSDAYVVDVEDMTFLDLSCASYEGKENDRESI